MTVVQGGVLHVLPGLVTHLVHEPPLLAPVLLHLDPPGVPQRGQPPPAPPGLHLGLCLCLGVASPGLDLQGSREVLVLLNITL